MTNEEIEKAMEELRTVKGWLAENNRCGEYNEEINKLRKNICKLHNSRTVKATYNIPFSLREKIKEIADSRGLCASSWMVDRMEWYFEYINKSTTEVDK